MKRATIGALLALASLALPLGVDAMPGEAPGSGTGDTGAGYSGLASVPEANLFTGAAQTSVPIEVPPGRLGLAPVLALSWSSVAGASAYGEGWTLPIPRVYRSTRRGVPRYDTRDDFVLEMPGAVVELERVPLSSRQFRARVESAFLRIGFDDTRNTWKVIDKLGVTFTFGTSAASRTGRGAARDATFSWLLDSIEDPAGNRIDFEYRTGGVDGVSDGLPSRIAYGANPRQGLSHFADVTFTWTARTSRSPTRVSWRNGFAEALDARLAAVETTTHGLAARRYDFSHEEDPISGDLRLVGVTLTAFAEDPADDVRLPSTVFVYAPSVHRGWSVWGSGQADPFLVPDPGILRIGDKTITADTLDVDGDAVVDRVETTTRDDYVRLGDGRGYASNRGWNWPAGEREPKGVRETDGTGDLVTNTFDLDGDGFADLVAAETGSCAAPAGNWCVWRGSADGLSRDVTFWPSPIDALRHVEGGGARVVSDLVDIDADGRLDLVDASGFDATRGVLEWRIWRNDGHGFTGEPEAFASPQKYLARSGGTRLAWGLVDMNADALPDLVLAGTGEVDSGERWWGLGAWLVHFNHGDGFDMNGTLWTIDGGIGDGPGLPNFLSLGAEDGSVLADVFDITGDGRPDLVRRQPVLEFISTGLPGLCRPASHCDFPVDSLDSAISTVGCCYNLLVFVNTGSSFSQPTTWSAPTHGLRSDQDICPDGVGTGYSCTEVIDFDFFDIDGDGLVEFVERRSGSREPLSWRVYPHPASVSAGGARPNLLVAMRNGIGGETMLRYTTASAAAGTRIPFPHWMVAERELRDSVTDASPLRTTFEYRGGRFDPERREVRGFAEVRETGPVGTTAVHEFHQDHRLAGRPWRVTELPPAPCQVSDPEDRSDPCSPWRTPLSQRRLDWTTSGAVLLRLESDVPWHGGAPVENLRRSTAWVHDAYGNVIERRIDTPLAPSAVTKTTWEHRVADGPGGMPATYSVAKPRTTRTLQVGASDPLVEKAFEYRWTAPAPGTLAAASTCVEWRDGSCSRWSRLAFEHDATGNVVLARAPDGAVSRTEYDADALFAVRSMAPAGLETRATTDPRTGSVTETVTPNGNRLRSKFDGLGRLLKTWGPGTSLRDPRRRVAYWPGSLAGRIPRVVAHDADGGSVATFFDGLGRPVAVKKDGSDGGRPVTVVSGLRLLDERGLVVAEALPFPSDDLRIGALDELFVDAPAWVEFAYDEVGRLVQTRGPDGATARLDRSAPGILRSEDANASDGRWPGSVTLEFFDGLGRRIARDTCGAAPLVSDPYDCAPGTLLRREAWQHDVLGRVVETRTSALGQAAADSVLRVAYDGLGNRVSASHDDAGAWRWNHDDSGRVVSVVKPDGVEVTTKYDAAGRIARRRGPQGVATYRYQSGGGGIGKVRRIVSRSSRGRVLEQMDYDDRGRVASRARRVSVRGVASSGVSVFYGYDDLDRRVTTSYEGLGLGSDAVVHTGYDELGRATNLRTDASTIVAGIERDWMGRTTRVDYGNGLSDALGWDTPSNERQTTAHLRCARTTRTAQASTGPCAWAPDDLDGLGYGEYDANGKLLATTDPLRSHEDPLSDARRYRYDSLGRLSSFQRGQEAERRYEFDATGNILRHGTVRLDYADARHPGRLTSVSEDSGAVRTVEHDELGRRTRDGSRAFAWDDSDRLVETRVDGETVLEQGYTDSGERAWTTDPRIPWTTVELGDGLRIDGDRIERTLFLSGRAVAVESFDASLSIRSGREAPGSAPSRLFLHPDHQQTVRLVSDADGNVVEIVRYEPFGQAAARVDASGRQVHRPSSPVGYSGHREDSESGLQHFGARHYDPGTASFLSPDPALQYASLYAYSDGNPVLGRDADGRLFGLTGLETLILAVGTATFVDSLASTGDLGHSLTAGIFAGFSIYYSAQLSTAVARPLVRSGYTWLQVTASVASGGFQAMEAAEAIEDGRFAGGIVAAGMLAASLIGIESANDPGPGSTSDEVRDRHGIEDRGVIDGRRVIDVNGICSTRPGCMTNTMLAARENLRVLFGRKAACVGGCEHVDATVQDALTGREPVLLRCNSFGAIKCLGAIQRHGLAQSLSEVGANNLPRLSVEMSGAPLLRPPVLQNVTYQVNLFDPVVWVGTAYSTPLRHDVGLGRNWWVPAPVIVHHSSMYEKAFFSALPELFR